MIQSIIKLKVVMITLLFIYFTSTVNAQTPWNIGGNSVGGTSEIVSKHNH
jgi:hypothetical protein